MFSTAKQLSVAFAEADEYTKRAITELGTATYTWPPPPTPATLSVKDAQKVLDVIKEAYLDHKLGKTVRPWELFDVTAELDPAQAWVGVELETGFDTQKEYAQVVNWMWDNINHSTIDAEGCGNYYCELTLPPMNASDFFSPKGHLNKLISFLNENKLEQDREASNSYEDEEDDDYFADDQIGLHVNVSTPALRALDWNAAGRVTQLLTASANMISDNDHIHELFGRHPYGMFYLQGGSEKKWIEGKLFDSTHDEKRIAKYMEVMARIVDVIEVVAKERGFVPGSKMRAGGGRTLYIKNFYEILSGKVPPSEMVAATTSNSIDYW